MHDEASAAAGLSGAQLWLLQRSGWASKVSTSPSQDRKGQRNAGREAGVERGLVLPRRSLPLAALRAAILH